MGYDGFGCVGILQSSNEASLFSINEWIGELQGTKKTHVVWICCVATHPFIFTNQVPNSIDSYHHQDPNKLLKIKSSSCVQSMQNFKQKFRVLLSLYPVGCEGQEFFPKETCLPVFPYNFSSHVIASYDRFWRLLGWSVRRIDTSLLAWLVGELRTYNSYNTYFSVPTWPKQFVVTELQVLSYNSFSSTKQHVLIP